MTSARSAQINSLVALVLGATMDSAGLQLRRVPQEEIGLTPEDIQRQREKRLNERRWAEMTQADIDRLTAAHEKRERRKAARQGS